MEIHTHEVMCTDGHIQLETIKDVRDVNQSYQLPNNLHALLLGAEFGRSQLLAEAILVGRPREL